MAFSISEVFSAMIDWVKIPDMRYRKVPLLPVYFEASRWPWHVKGSVGFLDDGKGVQVGEKYGWGLNAGGLGRFGGGWAVKFGIAGWGNSWLLDLVWGSLSVKFGDRPTRSVRREEV